MSKLFSLILLFSISTPALAGQKLILMGEGQKPTPALQQLSKWSQQGANNILIVAWASPSCIRAADTLKNQLVGIYSGNFELSCFLPENMLELNVFFEQLSRASAVYFTTGDSNTITSGLNALWGRQLKAYIQAAYNDGVTFAAEGTSVQEIIKALEFWPAPVSIEFEERSAMVLERSSKGLVMGEGSVHVSMDYPGEKPGRMTLKNYSSWILPPAQLPCTALTPKNLLTSLQ